MSDDLAWVRSLKTETNPDSAASAASLRVAFNRACETYPRHLAAFLTRDGEAAFRAWWGQFYDAVHSHTAGLEVLAEIARLKEALKEATVKPT